MTLIFHVSCTNCQNIIQLAEKNLNHDTGCEDSKSNSACSSSVSSSGSLFKWFSNTEAETDTVKEDASHWIKKALGQGKNMIIVKVRC